MRLRASELSFSRKTIAHIESPLARATTEPPNRACQKHRPGEGSQSKPPDRVIYMYNPDEC
jgi:hypothetical protein